MIQPDLHEAVRRAANPHVLLQRVAEAARSHVERTEGVLIGLLHGDGLDFVTGAGYLARQVGGRVPLDGSLNGAALRQREVLRCDDAEEDPRVNHALCREYRVVSSVAVPLLRRGEAIGVLNVSSSVPRAFDDRDVVTLRRLADFVSVVVAAAVDLAAITDSLLAPEAAADGAPAHDAEERFVAEVLTPGAVGDVEIMRAVERFLEGDGLQHVFQPIYDVRGGELFAVEALARFAGEPQRPPDAWFSDAHQLGCGVELEIVAVRSALASLPQLDVDVAMCVNAGPAALGTEDVLDLVGAADSRRVVMELTEQVRVDDYPRLGTALRRLRLMGVRLAIDDTGAGFASLAHILKLSPDIIKLDRDLTSGIDSDPVRQALASALVVFAGQTGAEIVAEGIECAAELDALRTLGIRYGQGYHLARPGPLAGVPACLPGSRRGRRQAS